jgi:hypothetical protein
MWRNSDGVVATPVGYTVTTRGGGAGRSDAGAARLRCGVENVRGCSCHWRCWVGVELLPAQGPWAGAAVLAVMMRRKAGWVEYSISSMACGQSPTD